MVGEFRLWDWLQGLYEGSDSSGVVSREGSSEGFG